MILALALVVMSASKPPCPPCPPAKVVHHRVVKHETSAWQRVQDGFRLTAGFRWDQECPDPVVISPRREHHDPFFIGASLTLPLTQRLDAFGNFDRDFTDGPDWNARAGISYQPFGR